MDAKKQAQKIPTREEKNIGRHHSQRKFAIKAMHTHMYANRAYWKNCAYYSQYSRRKKEPVIKYGQASLRCKLQRFLTMPITVPYNEQKTFKTSTSGKKDLWFRSSYCIFNIDSLEIKFEETTIEGSSR